MNTIASPVADTAAIDNPDDHAKQSIEVTRRQKLYRAAWRWHFYAGLYVVPFLLLLAITGLAML